MVRFLYAALRYKDLNDSGKNGSRVEEVKVVLISWLRGWDTWKEGGRRLVRSLFFLWALRIGKGGVEGGLE